MSKVKCELCDKKYSIKGGIMTHLKSCLNTREDTLGEYTMLKVCDTENEEYFLFLLIHKDETLCTLDIYLKTIWLECCGHLSQFYINPMTPDYAMFNNTQYHGPISELLDEGSIIHYDYDFGSTTTLKIECVKELIDYQTDEPIVLLARNENPFKNKDNSPRAGVCDYVEDVNYRMMFLKQYGDYKSDRKDMEAYTCHEFSEEFVNKLIDIETMDSHAVEEDLISEELEAAAMAYDLKIQKLLNKHSKPISVSISLREALERLNKKSIQEICRSHDLLPYSTQTKAVLVDRLVKEIPELFRDTLNMADHQQLEMYGHLKVTEEVFKEDIDIISQNDLFFVKSIVRHFVWLGLNELDELIYVLPQELRTILMEMDLNILKLRAQSNTKIIKYVKGLLNIYGVVEPKDMHFLLQEYLDLNMDVGEVSKIVSNACHFYSDLNDLGNYYTWREMEDAEDILEERAFEEYSPWKELTTSEIESAAKEFYYPEIDSFNKLKSLIIKHVDIPDDAVIIILNSVFELTTRFTDPEIIISYMAEIFRIENLSREEEVEIINTLEEVYYTCGMRVFKGFSMREVDE